MTEVIPGIYQLRLPIPETSLGYVNVYLVQGDNGYLLVDAGWNTKAVFDSLQNQLAEIGVGFEDIAQVVITHIHPDHYGLAGRLKSLSGAKIIFHHLEKELIESRYVRMDELLRQMGQWLHTNGVPANNLPELQTASVRMAKYVIPVTPDVTLYGGETVSTGCFSFQVLFTSGHSPGHISLYEPNRKILISGDHILPTITTYIGLHPQSGDNPLGKYINSLKAVEQLDVNLVLPGHENPFTALRARIGELIQHHKQRNEEILQAIKTKQKTAYQIATEITWMPNKSGTNFYNLAPFDKRLAIFETIAHLESMRVDGRVSKLAKDGIIYYQSG